MNTITIHSNRNGKEKLLLISRWFPYPADNGSKIRIFNLIRQLSDQYDIDLVSFAEKDEAVPEAVEPLYSWCRSVYTVHMPDYCPSKTQAVLALFSRLPRSVVITKSKEMKKVIGELVSKTHYYDVVIASQVDTAPYALAVDSPVRIFEEVELTNYTDAFRNNKSLTGRLRFGMTYIKFQNYIRMLASHFDGCTTASERERQELSSLVPLHDNIMLIPNGLDISSYHNGYGKPERDTLIYAGALTYHANFEAMQYFLRKIFPLILSKRPQAKLAITGKLNGVPVEDLSLEHLPSRHAVEFTGYLKDVRPKIARSWASVVPLRAGGGTRLKILESLALGTPVISTCKGAEGLDLIAGTDLVVADTPEDFAGCVLQVLQDEQLREHFSRCGRQSVAMKYDWKTIGDSYLNFLDRMKMEKQRA